MKRLAGIALIIVALSSGGIGIAMMGGGLAVPAFLVFGFGVYLLVTSFNKEKEEDNKKKNEDEKIFGKKNVFQLFLGILILIFGIINLINASLIMVSIIAIIVGGGLIYYNLSGSKEEELKIKKKKKKTKEKSGTMTAIIVAMGIVLVLGFLILVLGNPQTTSERKMKQEKQSNYRAYGVYDDELNMCNGYAKAKFSKKKFTKYFWESYTADKNKKTYTKKIKMWMNYDGLIRKNKVFKYVDCHILVKPNQTITFLKISDKY